MREGKHQRYCIGRNNHIILKLRKSRAETKTNTENFRRKSNIGRLPKCLSFVYLVPNHSKYVLGFILRCSLLLQSFFELLLFSLDFFYRLFQAVNSWISNHGSLSCSFCLLGFYLSKHTCFCFLSFCPISFDSLCFLPFFFQPFCFQPSCF